MRGRVPGRGNECDDNDGQANVGTTQADLIARHSDDSEQEGIYLVGVGCGNGYDDTIMDTVTDAGKGAYIFIDTKEEAKKMFYDRFISNLEIAVMDVRVELTLPPTMDIKRFYGEEYSQVEEEVEPQHLAPNDAMIYSQVLESCDPESLTGDEEFKVIARYIDPATRNEKSDEVTETLNGLLEKDSPQLLKGEAVVAYAEALKGEVLCEDAQEKVETAYNILKDDEDLKEIRGLLAKFCE